MSPASLRMRCAGLLASAGILGACGTVQYTVDDGRKLDETLLAGIRSYGKATQTIRPAVARSAGLAAACESAWELPFDTASSDELGEDERVAWARALKVDERLTVIAGSPRSPLVPGDRIVEIEGYSSTSARKMNSALRERAESGRRFSVRTGDGRLLAVEPMRVCRGRALAASPVAPNTQDYHWDYCIHPQEVFNQDLTADEALWLVLWTQGLSEEGGARMKAYQYGVVPAKFVVGIASILSGAGVVAQAAQSGGSAAASQVGVLVAKHVVAGAALDLAREQTSAMMETSSRNRADLEGVAWVGGTVFDRADQWSFARMLELGADPLAAVTLHRKLIQAGSARNAFVLDAERLPLLQALAEQARLGPRMAQLMNPAEPAAANERTDELIGSLDVEAMPLASPPSHAAPDQPDMNSLAMESAPPMPSGASPR